MVSLSKEECTVQEDECTVEEDECTMTCHDELSKLIRDFCRVDKESPDYLNHVFTQANRYRDKTVPLKKPTGYDLRIGGLNDTVYKDMENELEAWENLYTPERVEMEVIGAIDTFPCLAEGLQLIILSGGDGNIYAYEDEVLHQVADSLKDIFERGLKFPGTKIYNYAEFVETKVVNISQNEEQVKSHLLNIFNNLKIKSSGNKYYSYYTLEATVICITHYEKAKGEKTDTFYGASLSCRGDLEKKLMIQLSCLKTWNSAVAYAVSFAQEGGAVQFPSEVICRSFKRHWTERNYYGVPPCKNCTSLFQKITFIHRDKNNESAETNEPPWPYGNCAETESLSKLLTADAELQVQVLYKNKPVDFIKERAIVCNRARNTLSELLPSRGFELKGNDFQFFEP
ncbi:UNVERIFIED_CONTAM: hypothetical protein FKN15_006053 [Acipenser sinensis]